MAVRLGLAFLIIGVLACQTSAKRGYIMTAPSRFIPGRPENVCLDLVDVTTNISVELSLYKTTHTIASQPISVTLRDMVHRLNLVISSREKTRCVRMLLPVNQRHTSDYLALSVRGEELPVHKYGWSFYGQNIIRVLDRRIGTEITMIQTDKPVYKPLQLVRVRVMRLDTRLRPVNEPIDAVHIQTPSGVKVEQWKNLAVSAGLVSLQFQLSDEPEHGNWTVVLTENGRQETKTFSVREYVLPTFEVSIKPPGYALLHDQIVSAKICALYAYGQPVTGTLEGTICLVQPFMRSDIQKDAFCQNINKRLITGCTNIAADRMAAGWDYRYNDWKNSKLVFFATVTENATGIKVSSEETVLKFTNSPHVVKLQGADVFKPGIPYHAKVIVTTADGKAAPAQLVTILVDRVSTGQVSGYTMVYTTDIKGVAYVTIPPFIGHHLNITARLRLLAGSGDPATMAKLNPKAWYSPSGSFLQIVPLRDTSSLVCGRIAQFRVQYSTSQASNVVVLSKVVGVGDIATAHQQPVGLRMALRLNQRDPAVLWDRTNNWLSTPIQPNAAVAAQPADPSKPDYNPAQVIRTATHKGSFSVRFPVTSALSPQAHLVVYYSRPDGEVVSDSVTLSVPTCTENKVSLSLSKTEVKPGEAVQLSLSASAGSVCGYGIVDRNTFVHARKNYPTISSIVQQLEGFLLPTTQLSYYLPVNFYCENLHGTVREFPGYASYWQLPSTYRHRDSYQGFIDSGLIVTSDLKLHTAPCRRVYYRLHTPAPPLVTQLAGIAVLPTDPAVGPKAAAAGPLAKQLPAAPFVAPAPPAIPNRASKTTPALIDSVTHDVRATPKKLQHVRDVTSYFPETMLFDIVNTNALGKASLQVNVPDTLTQWIGNAVCTNEQDGVGVSRPVTLTAFKPYSVNIKLPSPTAIRGEIIPVAVTISNYLTTCLAVDLSLVPSPSYNVVGQFMVGPAPTLCVCGGKNVKRTYKLALKAIGEDIAITVVANAVNSRLVCPIGSAMSPIVGGRETVVSKLTVEPEGIPREYTFGDYICVTRAGLIVNNFRKEYRIPRSSSRTRVPRSTRAVVSVVGDLLQPAINNLEELVNLPIGTGEQNMVRFAPRVFSLKYMDSTQQVMSAAARKETVQALKAGYQRQLTYSHPDGSYSPLGPHKHYVSPANVGSVWLTAFVLKSYAQARPYIYIDNQHMVKSVRFIVGKQNPWGCFRQVGMVPHRLLRSLVDQSTQENYALTAYVAISMLEAGYRNVQRQVAGQRFNVVEKALECIFVRSRRFRSVRDGYSLSLISYAFALYNPTDPRAVRIFQMLHRQQSTDREGHKNWRSHRTSDRVQTGTNWFHRFVSAHIESTSYGLLATTIMANRTTAITNGLSIAKWLSEWRNAKGGFDSTQDTVIGLQALADYGAKFSPRTIAAAVTVDYMRSFNGTRVVDTRAATYSLTNQNKMTVQSTKLARIRVLRLNANGNGCFRFQANVKYNVRNIDSAGQPFLTTITVGNNTLLSQLCRRKPLLICTRYVKGAESNLVIMEIKMQTGWTVVESLVKQLLRHASLRIQRYEISPTNNALQIYFYSLTNANTCFYVYINKVANVRNGLPAVVTTYDYYKRDERQETTYHIICGPQVMNI